MLHNPNLSLNFDQISINDTFSKEFTFQSLDHSIFPLKNFHFINPYENNTEDLHLNDYFFIKKPPLLEEEINKSNLAEKHTKTFTNEKKFNKISFFIKKSQNTFNSESKKDNTKQSIDWLNIGLLKNNLRPKSNKGRKSKNDNSEGLHTKFSDDNLRRKAKVLILNNILEFVNEKIKDAYQGNIGHGIMQKKLLSINLNNKSDITIEHSKNLLNKTIGEILSEDISIKYKNYYPNYNKKLIERLMKEKDEKKRLYFKKLFNITFLQCIRRLNGEDIYEELKEFGTFNELKNKNKIKEADPEYIKTLEVYLSQFEEKIQKKKGRRLKKIRNEKKNEIKEI